MQALTEDLEAVKAAIDTIDSSGGTNIGEGLRVALDELDRLGTPDRGRVVVLLTDGDGFYDHALTDRAAASGTVVYTVGLGSGVRPALLESINCTMTPTRTSTTSTPSTRVRPSSAGRWSARAAAAGLPGTSPG